MAASYAQFRVGPSESSGEYRRPLDPGTELRLGASALGWTTLSARGGAIGRVVVERVEQRDGARADVLIPYTSNPFVVMDTLGDALGATAARLEGAGGWRIGSLGVGLGLGFEASETRTVASPVPRLRRVASPGVTAGLNYYLGRWDLEVGLFGRWQQTAQTIFVSSRAARTRVYVLGGYFEPVPLDLTEDVFLRRIDRRARAGGVSLGGRFLGVRWSLFARVDQLEEGQSSVLSNDPPTDRWNAGGWTAGFGAQRLVGHGRALVTLSARGSRLAGEAFRADVEEVNFETDEQALNVSGEVRLLRHNNWAAVMRFTLERENRQRRDVLARVGSDLKHWEPGAAIEVSRWMTFGLAVAEGATISQHAPWGTIPNPDRMGPAYRRYLAPELAVYGTETVSRSASLTLRWQARSDTSLWIRGRSTTVSGGGAIGRIAFLPSGTRGSQTLDLGVTLAGR
jgi:hypothetical protein